LHSKQQEAALFASTGFMIFAVDGISGFVEKHPTVKMLARASC
jgi:predicted tellurium resistance membrane protein TerC